MILGPGFHANVPLAVYLSDPCERPSLSKSTAIDLVSESARHAWAKHPRLGGYKAKGSAATIRGSLIDALLLDDGAGVVEVDADDFRTKAAKAIRDAAEAAGNLPVVSSKLTVARDTVKIIRGRFADEGIELDGERQLTAVWLEGETICRGRFDHVDHETLVIDDLKTCGSAHPDACRSAIEKYGYDIQAAAYVNAYGAIKPEAAGRVRFRWLFAETEPPFDTCIVDATGEMMEFGRRRWERALGMWRQCLSENRWPGYGRVRLGPSPGALSRDMEQQINQMGESHVDF